jgi:hypothetical protein
MMGDLWTGRASARAARGRHGAYDRGASVTEYVAALLVISVIAGVVVAAGGVPRTLVNGARYAICKVTQQGDCVLPESEGEAGGSTETGGGKAGPNATEGLDQEGYYRRLCTTLRLDCENWDPERGVSCNDQNIVRTYEHYAELYRDHPELHWAGMAKLAGGLIYAGMQDMHVLRKLTGDARREFLQRAYPGMPGPLLDAMAGATEAEIKYYENKIANMQKQVFRDLGWQHEAYATGGIEEMRRLDAAGDLPPGMIDAWEDIASGDPDRIKRGNEDLLFREQEVVLQDDYEDMKGHHGLVGLAATYMIGLTAESPIPGGKPFREVSTTRVGTPEQVCTPWGWCQDIPSVGVQIPENIADLDSRWDWITGDMLPRYQRLLEEQPELIGREIDRPLLERAQDYRLVPIGYNPQDGAC